MDGGVWWPAVHGVAKSWTRLSDFTFTFHFYALEKEVATHSSVLAWRIPGTGEPGGLPSMGSHRVRHDWSDLAAAAACITVSSLHYEEIGAMGRALIASFIHLAKLNAKEVRVDALWNDWIWYCLCSMLWRERHSFLLQNFCFSR